MVLLNSYELLDIPSATTILYIVGAICLIATTIASRRYPHHSPPNLQVVPRRNSPVRPRPFHGLPFELRRQIYLHLIELLVSEVRYVRSLRKYHEELYQRVKTISQCWPEWDEMTDRVWASMWATGVSLWAEGVRYCNIRILIAEQEGIPLHISLSPFRCLLAASLNLHSSFTYSKNTNNFRLLPCTIELPPSLEHLEIMFFHGPDSDIFDLAARCCPDLVELRLVRCTMFNKPTCWWWRGHPASTDHTYMRNHNVTDATNYAVAIASLVRRLPKLERLHLGDYHTNFDAIMIHRMNHRKCHPVRDRPSDFNPMVHSPLHLNATRADEDDGGPPVNDNFTLLAPLELWSADCPECRRMFASETEAAERRAAAVLAIRIWSLQAISFASFFSDRRVGPSSWDIRRRGQDASRRLLSPEATQELGSSDAVSGKLRVETFRANDLRSVQVETFERREVGWSIVV